MEKLNINQNEDLVKADENLMKQIIEQWTMQYPPAGEDDMFVIKLTSYKIGEILADFAFVTPGDITRELLMKGYKLVRSGEGEMKWLIKKGEEK